MVPRLLVGPMRNAHLWLLVGANPDGGMALVPVTTDHLLPIGLRGTEVPREQDTQQEHS